MDYSWVRIQFSKVSIDMISTVCLSGWFAPCAKVQFTETSCSSSRWHMMDILHIFWMACVVSPLQFPQTINNNWIKVVVALLWKNMPAQLLLLDALGQRIVEVCVSWLTIYAYASILFFRRAQSHHPNVSTFFTTMGSHRADRLYFCWHNFLTQFLSKTLV